MSSIYGQKTVISTSRFSILYHDFPNKLDIAVSNRPCSDLRIKTSNGVITLKDSCTYELRTERPGQAWIVTSSASGLVYDSLDFRVKKLPNPQAVFVYDRINDKISRPRGNLGITTQLVDFDYDINYDIKSYTVYWISDSDTISSAICDSYKLSDKAKGFINDMTTGDKIIFSDIIAVGLYNIEYKLEDVEYIYTEN